MADFDKIAAAFKLLASKRVLVGIPMETSAREQTEQLAKAMAGKEPISNASLGYIHERGSPARNIPARPHLVPGVQKAMPQVQERLGAAARAAANGNISVINQYLGQAGQIAADSVKKMIDDRLKPDLAESTIAARRLRRPDIHYRVRERIVRLEQARRDARRQGLKPDPGIVSELNALRSQYGLGKNIYLRQAQTAEEVTPLVDTGAYRNAITSVVRDKE